MKHCRELFFRPVLSALPLLLAIAFFSMAAFFSGCSKNKPSHHLPDMKITKTALSGTVDPENPAAALKTTRTVFSAEDPAVSSVVALENLHSAREIRWEWITPDNRLYYKTKDFPIGPEKGKYIRSGQTWHTLSIDGEPAAAMPGKWKVNVYLDGARAATDTFYLSEAMSASGLPPILNVKEIELSSNVLEGGHEAVLSVTLENVGPGDAKDVYLTFFATESDIRLPERVAFDTIAARGGVETVTVPVKGGESLDNGTASLDILVEEPNFRVRIRGKRLTFQTREMRKPELLLARFEVVESEAVVRNKIIEINEVIDVRIAVQNVGTGPARDVVVNLHNDQRGVQFLGQGEGRRLSTDTRARFDVIEPGQHHIVNYRFFVNSDFEDEELRYTVSAREDFGRFGFDESRTMAINTEIAPVGEIRVVEVEDDFEERAVKVEDIPDFAPATGFVIPETDVQNPDAVAVVIGNKNYRNPDVPEVAYATRDARAIVQFLTRTMGFREKNIILRNDATISDFNDIFGTGRSAEGLLHNYVKPGRSDVFIYYSGHGVPDLETQTGYIMPVDCHPNRPKLNGYSLDLFYENISRIEARNVTVVMDACFSGMSGSGAPLIRGASPIVIEVQNPAVAKGNTITMASAGGDQLSSWHDEKQHSLFTYFFLKGISGAADLNGNRRITYAELYEFVSDRHDGVPYYARRLHGRVQTPVIEGRGKDTVFVSFARE